MFDLIKKSISSSPLGQAFTTAKNIVTGLTQPKQPTVAPQVSQSPVPLGPVQPVRQPAVTQVAPPVAQAMVQQKMTDTVPVTPSPKVSSKALAPENTMSSLLQSRKQLEDRFLKSLQPSDLTNQLAEVRLEAVDLQEKYKKEYEALKANPEGKLTANLTQDLRNLKEKQNEQLGYLAMRESALTGAIQLDKEQQQSIIENIKTISGLTQADMIGSLQTDEVTGDVYAYFRDPDTGSISQQTVGKTNIKPTTVQTGGGSGALGLAGISDAFSGQTGLAQDPLNAILSFSATLPTVGERDSLGGAVGAVREAQKMVNLLGAEKTNTGLLSGLGAKLTRPFGLTTQEQDNLNASMVNYRAQFIKAISGAAVTDQERRNLMQTLPSEFKPYQSNIAGFYSTLGYLDSIYSGKYGFDLTSTMPAEVRQQIRNAQAGVSSTPFTSPSVGSNSFSDLNK